MGGQLFVEGLGFRFTPSNSRCDFFENTA